MAAARNVSQAANITLKPSRAAMAPSLPMVVVLPAPLTPTTRMTKGFSAAEIERHFDRLQHLGDFAGENALHLFRIDLLVVAPGGHRLDDALGHRQAEVGLQQHVFQFLQASSSSSLRLVKMAVIDPVIDFDDFERPSLSRANQPLRSGSGSAGRCDFFRRLRLWND